jgi:hypothetical protein
MQNRGKREKKKRTYTLTLTLESNRKYQNKRMKRIILVIMQIAGGSITDAQSQIEERTPSRNANCRCLSRVPGREEKRREETESEERR